MIRSTLTSLVLCGRCLREIPAGVELLEFSFGPVALRSCIPCDDKLLAANAAYALQRRQNDAAKENTPVQYGLDPDPRGFDSVSSMSAFSDLPPSIQDAQQRAVGDR